MIIFTCILLINISSINPKKMGDLGIKIRGKWLIEIAVIGSINANE
jgi:hypothetical protein